ncbi:hypothetical protein PInf_004911 [Phytophthora infestans]|nr:hypothetical protein PInf_004911 [Phytophthora infestans]
MDFAVKQYATRKDQTKLSDEGLAHLNKVLAENAKKNIKSWPQLRMFAKVTLGATAGGLAIYDAYKLFDKGHAPTPMTPTTGTTCSTELSAFFYQTRRNFQMED